jgi:hypothetical protein
MRQVFSLQSNGAAGGAGQRFGKQDKARISSARAATPQPAVVRPTRRATRLHHSTTRSPNGNSPHKTRVHLDLWVNPIVKAELQRIAEQEGISVTTPSAITNDTPWMDLWHKPVCLRSHCWLGCLSGYLPRAAAYGSRGHASLVLSEQTVSVQVQYHRKTCSRMKIGQE